MFESRDSAEPGVCLDWELSIECERIPATADAEKPSGLWRAGTPPRSSGWPQVVADDQAVKFSKDHRVGLQEVAVQLHLEMAFNRVWLEHIADAVEIYEAQQRLEVTLRHDVSAPHQGQMLA